jgi:hypothetical protein
MRYYKKCSDKGALSGHVIQLSIKTLTSKFSKWMFPIVHSWVATEYTYINTIWSISRISFIYLNESLSQKSTSRKSNRRHSFPRRVDRVRIEFYSRKHGIWTLLFYGSKQPPHLPSLLFCHPALLSFFGPHFAVQKGISRFRYLLRLLPTFHPAARHCCVLPSKRLQCFMFVAAE